ncbi:hypothetical protein SADUNF_Sadunf08G0111600 [Salix dunnii]|uniref:Uncharacterized protein n=1 Tax=Salix dunnii TaxID=1413687 RepID=A0A835JTZ4_9ROSI|nr:hypothetical protein SADUNF_Sadunf08G0111600 [Salix dunnii]
MLLARETELGILEPKAEDSKPTMAFVVPTKGILQSDALKQAPLFSLFSSTVFIIMGPKFFYSLCDFLDYVQLNWQNDADLITASGFGGCFPAFTDRDLTSLDFSTADVKVKKLSLMWILIKLHALMGCMQSFINVIGMWLGLRLDKLKSNNVQRLYQQGKSVLYLGLNSGWKAELHLFLADRMISIINPLDNYKTDTTVISVLISIPAASNIWRGVSWVWDDFVPILMDSWDEALVNLEDLHASFKERRFLLTTADDGSQSTVKGKKHQPDHK